ncbi:MAG: hypothetical protein ABIN89_01115 [Chitinophagaceae bacterium]
MASNSNEHPLIKTDVINLTWYDGRYPINEGTAISGHMAIKWESNTGLITGQEISDLRSDPTQDYKNTRQFIKLDQAFREQLKEYSEAFKGKTNFALKELMNLSSDILLKTLPDKISLQLTEEGCIFYTLLKNNITIFFSHYLTADIHDIDESIISIYKGESNLLNYAGELWETIHAANKVLHSFNIAIPEFA